MNSARWNIERASKCIRQTDGDAKIACVLGPGGFTSLRVAVGLTNALAGTLDIPSCGIHLSDLYAALSMEKDFLWLHSTKKKELFARGFGFFQSTFPEAKCFGIDEIEKLLT